MARGGGFPVDDDEIIETLERMLRAAGEVEACGLIKNARWRFEKTGRDNWDGGTDVYTLTIEVAVESYVPLGNRREAIQKLIGDRLDEVVKQFRSGWYSVELVPMVVSLPGRPDLEGGPVSYRTRRALIRMMQAMEIPWQGAVGDVAFLEKVFDLEALPSHDGRYTSAAGDIYQHRYNNDDWFADWIFGDERFDLMDVSDAVFLQFMERLVASDVRPDPDEAAWLAERINAELQRSGWTLVARESLSGELRYRAEPWDALHRRSYEALRSSAAILSSSWMQQELSRMEAAVDSDPALAIGTAKEMLETCCKKITEDLSLEGLPQNPDLPQLVKAVTKALKLLPDDVPQGAKGAESIERLLKNFAQITQGLGELRKHYGTGHGRSGSHRGLSSRHARLAVGAAAVFIEFVVATHKERLAAIEKAA